MSSSIKRIQDQPNYYQILAHLFGTSQTRLDYKPDRMFSFVPSSSMGVVIIADNQEKMGGKIECKMICNYKKKENWTFKLCSEDRLIEFQSRTIKSVLEILISTQKLKRVPNCICIVSAEKDGRTAQTEITFSDKDRSWMQSEIQKVANLVDNLHEYEKQLALSIKRYRETHGEEALKEMMKILSV